jgi:hypothetical protein
MTRKCRNGLPGPGKTNVSVNRVVWEAIIHRYQSYQIGIVGIIGKLSQGLCLFPSRGSNYQQRPDRILSHATRLGVAADANGN